MQTFEKNITVTADDLDQLNHVNNVRYVQWVQDIAAEHWNSKVTKHISDSYFWVLLKHTIEYKGEALLNDVLTVKTFVEKSEGVTSIRHVEIINKNTNKLLTASQTTWCLISKETKRPTRVTPEIINLFN